MQLLFSNWSICTSSVLAIFFFLYCSCAEPFDFNKCDITENFKSEYVTASFKSLEPGLSCETNTTDSSGREVHVIVVKLPDLKDNGRRMTVRLDINSRRNANLSEMEGVDFQEHLRPLIFVLHSSAPVKWNVEIYGITSQEKHQFVISKDSKIKFQNQRTRLTAKRRCRDLPTTEDSNEIYQWAKQRLGTVTSYSEISNLNMKFYIGRDANASSRCNPKALSPSLRIFSFNEVIRPMQGCVNERRNHVVAKPVYILELLDPPSQSPGISGIDLEILTVNADGQEEDLEEEEMDRDIHLLIKSPPNLKWSLHSKSIAGLMEIVADADVRTTGVKFSSVALRTEVITVSGRDLVDWSKDFIAPVQLYAGIHGANTIKLKIPPTGKNKASPRDRTTSSNRRHEKDQGRKSDPEQQDPSKNQIRTTCAGGQMEVAISKIFIEWAGLGEYKISLTDPTCQPTEESDEYIILRTGLTTCGTQAAAMDDVVSFTNAVIIKTPPGLVNSYLEDEVGSGFFREEGGSGLDDLDPLTDDEDYGKKHLNITVECKISIEKPSAKCDMILYKDPLFLITKTNYPVTVVKDSFMLIKASIGSDSTLMVDSCWFSNSKLPQDSNAHTEMIVSNGCERNPYFNLIDPPMESQDGPNMNEAKFTIIFKDWIKGYSQIYLHCQFYSCQRSSAAGCMRGPRKGCTENVPGVPRPRRPACAPVTIGPLELIDRDIPKVLVPSQPRSDYGKDDSNHGQQQRIIVEGLDSATVVGIAFAAFAIGILLTGALWFIHSHTGPIKRGVGNHRGADASGDLTPNSSSPMTA